MGFWDRYAVIASARRSWVMALLIAVAAGVLMAFAGTNAGGSESPVPVPPSAESARAALLAKDFPGGDKAPVILVVSRADGAALSPTDLVAADEARQRVLGRAGVPEGAPTSTSEDGAVALA